MFNNLLKSFSEVYLIKGDELIIESYKVKEGLYVQIDVAGSPAQHMVIGRRENQISRQDDAFLWFKRADFYSCYLNSNKSVSSKRIHSNNCFSVFVKKDNLIGNSAMTREDFLEEVKGYFVKLRSEDFNQPEVLATLSYAVLDKDRQASEHALISFFLNHMDWLKEQAEHFSNYVKVFVNLNGIEDFKGEGERYLRHKVFNNTSYNIFIEDVLFGLSDTNMGMNSKKPYLAHKTTPFEVPYRVSVDQAIMLYWYSIWLKNQGYGERYIPQYFEFDRELSRHNFDISSEDAIYIYCGSDNDQVVVEDFDIVPNYVKTIPFVMKNVLNADAYDKTLERRVRLHYSADAKNSLEAFLKSIDKYLFNTQLIDNLKRDPKDVKPSKFMSKRLANSILLCRDAIDQYVNKGDTFNISSVVNSYFRPLIFEMAAMDRYKGIHAYNCYVACLKTFNLGGDILENRLRSLHQEMRESLETEPIDGFKDKDLYSFVAGQVAYFLLYNSQSKNATHSVIENFTNKETVGALNEELQFWHEKYGHAIKLSYVKFNTAVAKIKSTPATEKVNKDLFIAGLLSSNQFLETQKVIGGKNHEEA